jgi:D-alanyl-D-alanine carboxypeptidase
MRHKPDFAPGTGWSYSNTGYALLGMIVQRVTGAPWYQEVRKRIIEPLGLRHTIWPGSSPELPAPHAHGYALFTTGEGLVDVTKHRDADASGGIISTPADMNRFFRALLVGKLLRPAQLAQMKHTVRLDAEMERFWPGARYGLGLFSRPLSCGGIYWSHGGDILGFMSRGGVSGDGKRSVTVALSSLFLNSEAKILGQDKAAGALVDRALCGRR